MDFLDEPPARGFLRDSALAAGSSLAASAATFLFYIASARALGVEDGGLLLATVAGTSMLAVPGAIAGLALAAAAARLRGAGRGQTVARMVARSLLATVCFAVSAIVTAALAAPALGGYFGARPDAMFAAGCIVAVSLPLLALRGLIQGVGSFGGLAASNLVECAGRVVLSAMLLLGVASLPGALTGLAIVLASSLLITIAVLVRATGWDVGRFSADREAFRGATSLVVTMGSLTMLSFFDAVVARHDLSPTESGLYNAAALAGRALMTLLAFAPSLVLPKLAHAVAAGQESRVMIRQTLFVTAAVCIGAAAAFALFPQLVIHVVAGPRFLAAAPLIGVYGWAASALAFASVLSSLRLGAGSSHIAWFVGPAAVIEIVLISVRHTGAVELVQTVALGHTIVLAAALAASAGALRLGGREDIVGT